MTEHTELPWNKQWNGHFWNVGTDCPDSSLKVYPCSVIGVLEEANAQLIVTAVNNHAKLVEALRSMLSADGHHEKWAAADTATALLTKLGEPK